MVALIILVLLILLLAASLYVVPQQQAYIIERLGKFKTVQFAGMHAKIPFVDRIARKTDLRVMQINVKLETKRRSTTCSSRSWRAPSSVSTRRTWPAPTTS